jgi:hypothetical protein
MGGTLERYAIDNVMAWRHGNLCYSLTIVALFITSVYGVIIGDTQRAFWGFCAVALAAIPALVEWLGGWIIPWPAKFLIGLTLVLHIAGGVYHWYFNYYPIYDKIAHLVASMTVAFLTFLFLLFLAYSSVVRLGRWTIVFLILAVSLLFGFGWELGEYLIDQNLFSTYFTTFYDSLMDTIFNILGCGYIAFHANEYLKLESPEKLWKRFVRR